MSEHLLSGWGVAKILGATLMTAIVWQFKRFALKVDRLEELAAKGVTRNELDSAIDRIKQDQRDCKKEIIGHIDALERHITDRMVDHCGLGNDLLRRENFAKLRHGFVGWIEDQDQELDDDK